MKLQKLIQILLRISNILMNIIKNIGTQENCKVFLNILNGTMPEHLPTPKKSIKQLEREVEKEKIK